MFLLNEYKSKNTVVAHVNYHKRFDSDNDQKIVEDFCKVNNIPLEILHAPTTIEGNFQDWARKVRYNFFKEVYLKYGCEKLLTAHHKDDFLETAMIQFKSGRTPKYYGIQQKIEIDGVKIERPYVGKFWKHEIADELVRRGIKFATDYTNDQPIYERNRVRIELSKLTTQEKQKDYLWFVSANKILAKKNKTVTKLFLQWKMGNYSVKIFKEFKKYEVEVAYEYLHERFGDVNITSGKLKNFVLFINGIEGGKTFVIDAKNKVKKNNGFLE